MERKNNTGGNSQLKGKFWNCPDDILSYLSETLKNFELKNQNKKTEGYNRAKNIINNKKITYENLKRIKNWFDTYEGKNTDWEYLLHGGNKMKEWVENTLYKATKGIKDVKDTQNKSGTKDNTHIKTHTKDKTKISFKTITPNIPKLHKSKVSQQIWSGKPIYEEIERIKNLITYNSKI